MTRQSLLLAALAAAAACGKSGAADEAKADNAQPVVGARTAVVATRPFTQTVNAIGTVAARPGHFASLSAPAPTRVANVFVTLGQHVKKGDPLVELEQQSFVAALQSADAALATAQSAYARQLRLAAEGINAKREVDQAASELAQAKATQIAAHRLQELSTLKAPIDGVITRMNAVLGASVDITQALVDVTDPNALDVLLQLTPGGAGGVRPGQSVSVIAGQSASGERLGEGTVADVSAALDSTTRTVGVRVTIARPARTLRVGETVMGAITVGQNAHAIAVPVEALVPEGEGYKVFVVDTESVAHAREVTIGGRTEQWVEITKGLRAGETIVTFGAFGVSDSSKIVNSDSTKIARPDTAKGAKQDSTKGAKPTKAKP
jgi:membrane fusion protein, multidrug efflux system